MIRQALLSLFLTRLIQDETGLFRVFERIRVDLPQYLADNDYNKAAQEVEMIVKCPFCLSAYTSIIVLMMPVSMRRWLEVWMIAYVILWIYKENKTWTNQ